MTGSPQNNDRLPSMKLIWEKNKMRNLWVPGVDKIYTQYKIMQCQYIRTTRQYYKQFKTNDKKNHIHIK